MGREEAFQELETVYADLERELATLRPRCDLSSRCCRFTEFGHQLWTSALELEYLLAHEPAPVGPAAEGVCPYLKDGRCGARDHRMLGCRIFFCDPGYKDAMGPLYEKHHRAVKAIHVRHGIPYLYGEFLQMRAKAVRELL
jgi:hypothetical protein